MKMCSGKGNVKYLLTFFPSDTMYKCMSIYKRSEDILEIQEGRLQQKISPTDDVCSAFNMDEDRMPFTTLLSKYEVQCL